MTHFRDGAGGYAELAVVDAGLAAPIGPATSMTEAAAAPLAGRHGLDGAGPAGASGGQPAAGLGASGGVGLFLLQLAARQGIEVIAVGRQAMHPQMLALGAASCVDYTVENVTRRTLELAGGPVDAVADLVGGRAPGGIIGNTAGRGQAAAIATPELDLDPLLDANITFHGVLLADNGQRTRDLAALLAREFCARSSATSSPWPKRLRPTASWRTSTPAERSY